MDKSYQSRFFGKSPFQSPMKLSYSTPNKIPVENVYHDRFIPVRTAGVWKETQNEHYRLVLEKDDHDNLSKIRNQTIKNLMNGIENQQPKDESLSELISSEALSNTNNSHNYDTQYNYSSAIDSPKNSNIFTYRQVLERLDKYKYSVSPFSDNTNRLLKGSREYFRRISRFPYQVLDAPNLQNDFYSNVVDWSYQDMLAVGLGTCLYTCNIDSTNVKQLCDVTKDNNVITSVAWSEKGTHLAIGTYRGKMQIWDITAETAVWTLQNHTERVGALAWNVNLLASGGCDKFIYLRDIRDRDSKSWSFRQHTQEVCGLKWSIDKINLASGGNDNKVMVWNLIGQSGSGASSLGTRATGGLEPLEPISTLSINDTRKNDTRSTSNLQSPPRMPISQPTAPSSSSSHSLTPLHVFDGHLAAVKALGWSPHQHGLLASGGGTIDRCIKFWDILTGNAVHSVDTGSQVCNIAWSPHANELVSTHGYSKNHIIVWEYLEELKLLASLTGHDCRVLFLAMNPDGSNIVTGAADGTLRFWNVFEKQKTKKVKFRNSVLDLFGGMR